MNLCFHKKCHDIHACYKDTCYLFLFKGQNVTLIVYFESDMSNICDFILFKLFFRYIHPKSFIDCMGLDAGYQQVLTFSSPNAM